MSIKLRAYQEQAVYLVDRALNAREHPLCVLPTAAGKSLVLASLIEKRGGRILVLSHVKELLEQDSRILRRIAPDIPQGFFSAGLKEKRGSAQVVFASVQSAYRSLSNLGARSLILIDEAHLTPRDADAMYAKVFTHFSLALRAGFTATPMRLDSGSLVGGEDAWFTTTAIDVPVSELIKQRFLVPLAGVLTEHQADLSGVGSRGGDFVSEQAERAVDSLSINEVIGDIVRLAAKRAHWLIFAAGVKHAEHAVSALKQAGIDAALVIGDTPSAERDEIISRFREGNLRALVNVGVLTTGFDAPQTDCIVSLRPTKSPVLWQQVMGRGMRLSEGKQNCLLLDFVGNLERLGGAGCVVETVDERADLTNEKPRTTAPKRVAPKVDPTYQSASLADPMKSGRSFEASVKGVRFFIVPSKKFPGKRMLIASYSLEDENGTALEARSFVAVEFPGSARYHAVRWFARRGITDSQSMPQDAQTALALAKVLPVPAEVRAYWDSRMHCYLLMEERFAVEVAPAEF